MKKASWSTGVQPFEIWEIWFQGGIIGMRTTNRPLYHWNLIYHWCFLPVDCIDIIGMHRRYRYSMFDSFTCGSVIFYGPGTLLVPIDGFIWGLGSASSLASLSSIHTRQVHREIERQICKWKLSCRDLLGLNWWLSKRIGSSMRTWFSFLEFWMKARTLLTGRDCSWKRVPSKFICD